MTATTTKEDDCPECFGRRNILQMRVPRFGYPNDTSPGPVCRACDGSGKKPKPD
jgi:hypothetical protein